MSKIESKRREWCQEHFLLLIVLLAVSPIFGDDSNPFLHTKVLDRNGKYVLQWLVNWEEDRIYFNVTAETLGYVGFGLSRKGKMAGADIVIGGLDPNGQPYFRDYYAIGNQQPVMDTSQDWTLHSARESRTHTFLSFSRRLETCDNDHDLPINEDVLALLWCYGERDRIEYHYQNRGSFDSYLLDPDLTPRTINELHYRNVSVPPRINQLGNWKVWSLSFSQEMPSQDTTYHCTFHKAPTHPRKQHIVGMRTVLNSAIERRHIHHFLLHKCYAPPGVDINALYTPLLGRQEECYVHFRTDNPIPSYYCLEVKHEWAVGGGSIFFPEHVGLPFTESENEFYMFQVHYDNPQGVSNVRLEYALEIYYTEELRQYDAGLMLIGSVIGTPGPPLIMVPPSARNHDSYGLCPTQCTQKMFSQTGVNVFAARSHTHLAGRRTRFLQVQNGRELPIIVDDNFNFNYQDYRLLRTEKRILPGDNLGHWCTFETSDREGNATAKGFATKDEMCHGYMWYYPYTITNGTYGVCASELRSNVYRNFLQINTTVWSQERRADIVETPVINAGLTTQDAGTRIDWTISRRTELQRMHRNLPQVAICSSFDPVTITSEIQAELARQRGVDDGRAIVTPDGVILRPESEFISRWPMDIATYQKSTRCPR